MSRGVCKEDQIKLIMECRQSGLSDFQWCQQHDIYPPTFYNWISKLKKCGYTFPDSSAKIESKPNRQEVVKIDLVDAIPELEQNVSLPQGPTQSTLAAELQVGNITLRLFNGADEHLIQSTLTMLGGMKRAW